jgi:glycosyltransferase involved in cell wall biosynthesis
LIDEHEGGEHGRDHHQLALQRLSLLDDERLRHDGGNVVRNGPQITVVVPAYREAERVARVIRGVPPEVSRIIVVDDASDDETAGAARSTDDARMIVIRHDRNRGVGAAIVTGYRAAMQAPGHPRDAFVVMAGDAQMDPADLPRVAAPVLAGEAGYVKGDRFGARDTLRVMPKARWVGGQALSRLTSRAIGLPVSDSQCGYTALSREACERLDLASLWPRYGYPNDLLSQLALRRIPIREVPVRAIYAGERSGLRAYHVATILRLVARAYVRRLTAEARAPGWTGHGPAHAPSRRAP